MPIIAEQHLAQLVGPVRVAAAGAVAACDAKRAFDELPAGARKAVQRQVEWSRMWSEGSVAGLQEAIRRSRENSRPDLGEPDLSETIGEVVASLAEMYAALRLARQEIQRADLSRHTEPVAGRYGELAAQVADWATTATELHRSEGGHHLRPGVNWGPDPGDPRIGAAVALALTASFALSSALAALATIDDNRRAGGADSRMQPIFNIGAQTLWAATELSTGVALCLNHLADGHVSPDDSLDAPARCVESARRYRTAVALQLEDLDRYQPADAPATREGYVTMLKLVDEDLQLIEREI